MKYSKRILIIAEVGINHKRILKAKMIDIAKNYADYVTNFKPHNLAIEKAKCLNSKIQGLYKYKLNFSDFRYLYKYANKKNKILATHLRRNLILNTLKLIL